mgnify:CR=1 FL=1
MSAAAGLCVGACSDDGGARTRRRDVGEGARGITKQGRRDVGLDLWTKTDLRPADVDVAGVYDGFTFITMAWLEALGFCGKGEGGPFVWDGRITRVVPFPSIGSAGSLGQALAQPIGK